MCEQDAATTEQATTTVKSSSTTSTIQSTTSSTTTTTTTTTTTEGQTTDVETTTELACDNDSQCDFPNGCLASIGKDFKPKCKKGFELSVPGTKKVKVSRLGDLEVSQSSTEYLPGSPPDYRTLIQCLARLIL